MNEIEKYTVIRQEAEYINNDLENIIHLYHELIMEIKGIILVNNEAIEERHFSSILDNIKKSKEKIISTFLS